MKTQFTFLQLEKMGGIRIAGCWLQNLPGCSSSFFKSLPAGRQGGGRRMRPEDLGELVDSVEDEIPRDPPSKRGMRKNPPESPFEKGDEEI